MTGDQRPLRDILAKAMELSSSGILVADCEGVILWANDAYTRITGYPQAECLGQKPALFRAGTGDRESFDTPWAAILAGRGWEGEILNRQKDGSVHPAFLVLIPISGDDGAITHFAGILRDLRRLKAVEEACRLSEARFRDLVENTSDWIWEVDEQLRYTYASPKVVELLGYEPGELLGKTPWDLMLPGEVSRLRPQLEELLKLPAPFRALENTNLHKDGSRRLLEMSGVPVYDAAGRFRGFRGIDRDITELKRAEKSRKLWMFAEMSPDLIWRVDLEPPIDVKLPPGELVERLLRTARLGEANEAMAQFLGLRSAEEALGLRLNDLAGPLGANLERMLGELVRSGFRLANFECNVPDAQGAARALLCNFSGIIDGGRLHCVWAIARDITEHQRADQELRESEERYRRLIDMAEFPVVVSRLSDGVVLYANARAADYAGIPATQAPGVWAPDFWVDPAERARFIGQMVRDGTVRGFEARLKHANGSPRWANLSSTIIQFEGYPASFTVFDDITEQRKTEAALRESEQRYRDISLSMADSIFEVDANFLFTWVSDRIFQVLGYLPAELIGKPPFMLFDEGHAVRAIEEARRYFDAREKVQDHEIWHRARDGRRVCLLVNGGPCFDPAGKFLGYRGVLRDVTERRRAEEEREKLAEQLQQAHKLESLGRLAGGVAHDFNNLLTVINGYSELLLRRLGDGDPSHSALAEIRRAGARACDLTQQLLAFSRNQVVEPKPVELNALVLEHLDMLARLAGEDIELRLELSPQAGRVMADPGQLHQVLMNLVANGRDAMPTGGEIVISTGTAELDEDDASNNAEAQPGSFVTLVISDTGVGIDPEISKRIFDPFFTTKETGRGTGLGLSTVYGIVRQNRGWIEIESQPGQGTRFRVYLRRTDSPEQGEPAACPEPASLRGGETILVVEDEDDVRRLAIEILRGYGYNVLEAKLGGDALETARRHAGRIHLLLTDVVMPRMNGLELAGRLGVLRPEMRVLFMSGYAEDVLTRHGAVEPGVNYLSKPFVPEALAAKVREALGVARSPRRILVADDNEGIRGLFELVLSGEGHHVTLASDGREALELMKRQAFDLVITDLVMPNREGIEMIRDIRGVFPELKILAVSGAFGGRFLRVAAMLGADATLLKPVSPDQLLEAVRRLLG